MERTLKQARADEANAMQALNYMLKLQARHQDDKAGFALFFGPDSMNTALYADVVAGLRKIVDFHRMAKIAIEHSQPINQLGYTRWVVADNLKIVAGNECIEDAQEAMDNLPRGRTYRICARVGLAKLGLNPAHNCDWSN